MLETVFLAVLVVYLLVKLAGSKRDECTEGLRLPPGSLGLPYIGETLCLAIQKVKFFAQRRQKYGAVYKTHLFGNPCIRVTGKNNVRKIMNGAKLVESCYPTSIQKLLGPNSLTMASGVLHKSRRRQLSRFLGADFLQNHRSQFVSLIRQYISEWVSKSSVEIYEECRTMALDLAAKYLVDMELSLERSRRFKALYQQFTDNMFSVPIDLPGFGFHKAMNAKRELKKMLKEISENSSDRMDVSPTVLEAYGADSGAHTEDDGHLDAILELLWNASETLTSALFSLCYFLATNTEVVNRLRQDFDPNSNESCRGTKTPSYLDCVVKEALRTMPPVGGAYRRAIRTFELDGYTIPEGWTIILGIRDTHENDDIFEPKKFNPDRWLANDAKQDIAYMPFGGGARACPGNKYALLVLRLFTKELCETCSWSLLTESPEITLFPRPIPKDPLHASFVPHVDNRL